MEAIKKVFEITTIRFWGINWRFAQVPSPPFMQSLLSLYGYYIEYLFFLFIYFLWRTYCYSPFHILSQCNKKSYYKKRKKTLHVSSHNNFTVMPKTIFLKIPDELIFTLWRHCCHTLFYEMIKHVYTITCVTMQ